MREEGRRERRGVGEGGRERGREGTGEEGVREEGRRERRGVGEGGREREREGRGSKRTNKRRGESNRKWKEKRVCTCMQLETESKLTYPSSESPSFYIVCLPKTTAISCVDKTLHVYRYICQARTLKIHILAGFHSQKS